MALVLLVRPGRTTKRVLAWARQLLPAAVLLIAPVAFPAGVPPDDDAIVLDADEIDSPMALAHAVAARHVVEPDA